MNTETDTPTPRTNKAFLDGYTFCKEDMMPAVAFASQLERELITVTEQRDEALSDLEFRRDLFKLQEQQLNDVRAERDRLAEALNRIANNNVQDLPETDYAYEPGRMEGIAKIALQPLTTNEQVKDIILSYCQGIYHLEFDIEDLDEMVEKIIDNVTDQCG
jgi:hypothetical protein